MSYRLIFGLAAVVLLLAQEALAQRSSPGTDVGVTPLTVGLDFGVTPDDFGSTNACGGAPIPITTEYVNTRSIVFGTAVAFPGGPVPAVEILSDGACSPPCRSSGTPVFTGDWWAQFYLGAGPGTPGPQAGVNQFSAEVCFADDAGDGLPDMIAYDINGNVIDQAFTVAGTGVQTLTVSDPMAQNRICFVQIVSSNDGGGLSIDMLDYDEPVSKVPTLPHWAALGLLVMLLAAGMTAPLRSRRSRG